MFKNIVISIVSAVVVFVIGIGLVGGNNQPANLGAGTPGSRFPHGITVGLPTNSPSNIGDLKVGTCNLLGMDVAQAASTTRPYDCAVTGVISTDLVFAVPSATTTATYTAGGSPFFIVGAKASTTAGYITFGVWNAGGASMVPSAPGGGQGIGSSTPYFIVKTQ